MIQVELDLAQSRFPTLDRARAGACGVICYPRIVAFTHQRGCAAASLRAAAAAAREEPNNPKQVAPEPDMRASRQPGALPSAVSTRAITGCSLIAAGSRSLAPAGEEGQECRRGRRAARVPAPARLRWRPVSTEHCEHVLGRHRDARIDQHGRKRAGPRAAPERTSPMPRITPRARIDADRHVGADPARRLLQPRDRRARCGWRAPADAAPRRHRTIRRRGRRPPAGAFRA